MNNTTNPTDLISTHRLVQLASRSEEFILPCLLLIGTTCNTLTFLVMRRGRMRHSSSCFYMAALAIADTFVLWIGCLNRWLELLDKQRPILACNMCCKLGTFGFFFFADCRLVLTYSMEKIYFDKTYTYRHDLMSSVDKTTTLSTDLAVIFE
jgi:hypothetical protein